MPPMFKSEINMVSINGNYSNSMGFASGSYSAISSKQRVQDIYWDKVRETLAKNSTYDILVVLHAREGELWKIEESLKIGNFNILPIEEMSCSGSGVIWKRFISMKAVGSFTKNANSTKFPNAMCIEYHILDNAIEYLDRLKLKVDFVSKYDDPALIGTLTSSNEDFAGSIQFLNRRK